MLQAKDTLRERYKKRLNKVETDYWKVFNISCKVPSKSVIIINSGFLSVQYGTEILLQIWRSITLGIGVYG